MTSCARRRALPEETTSVNLERCRVQLRDPAPTAPCLLVRASDAHIPGHRD